MEHRWGQRFKVAIEARLHLRQPYAARRGRVVNISASGAFIQTNIALPVLDCIQVEIQIPVEGGHASIRLPAGVVRRARDGVGVEWCEAESLVIAELVAVYAKPVTAQAPAPVPLEVAAVAPLAAGLAEASDLRHARAPGAI